MKPIIIPVPPGFEYLEIHGDEVFRAAVLAVAYDPERGLVPLGAGDKIDHDNGTALVLPDGQVEQEGKRWPTVDDFLAAQGIGAPSNVA